jgi:stage II sporulation protein E
LLEEIADRACATCDHSVRCWKEHFHATYQELLELLATAEGKGGLSNADMPAEFVERCPQVGKVVVAINQLMELKKVNTTWERRVAESKQIVYGQLTGVADIMQNLAREAKIEPVERHDLEKEISASLRRERVPVERVLVTRFDDERLAVEVSCRACGGVDRCRKQVPDALNASCNEVYSLYQAECGQESGKTSCQLRYLPERAFDLVVKGFKCVKDGNSVSGDNYAVLDLPGGKSAVVLSDGMGMGARAALESSATIDMLAQLMKAGFEREFAVRTVNSILMLRSQEESFATVDMLLFDLYSGEAEFVKIGACPSYIVRGREIQAVSASSIPIGILSNIDVDVTSRYLRAGDLAVMVTDGLGEAPSHEFTNDWILHALRNVAPGDPGAVAQHLLAQARQLGGGKVEDDQTVLVCQVQRRADYCLPQPLSQAWRKAGIV